MFGSGQYTVAHRGELSYSKEELASKGWRVEVALGQ